MKFKIVHTINKELKEYIFNQFNVDMSNVVTLRKTNENKNHFVYRMKIDFYDHSIKAKRNEIFYFAQVKNNKTHITRFRESELDCLLSEVHESDCKCLLCTTAF
jgi:hypothetical protein